VLAALSRGCRQKERAAAAVNPAELVWGPAAVLLTFKGLTEHACNSWHYHTVLLWLFLLMELLSAATL
jgi:hypothetical protein